MTDPGSQLVLVTGASGYLGSHVVRILLKEGYRVRGTVRSLKNSKKVDPIRKLDTEGRLEFVEADLTSSDGWEKALEGCDYVHHVASPLPLKGEESIIKVAIDGTLNVLRAATKTPSVKKVVLTSSSLAICEGHRTQRTFTEADWSNLQDNRLVPYPRSKVLAERAAWDFVESIEEGNKFELTVINPGLIVGPPLIDEIGSSITLIKRFLEGDMPGIPALHMMCVDVRDVAKCHLEAMRRSESDGQRFLTISQPSIWLQEIGVVLQKEFQNQGYKIATRKVPSCLVKLLAMFDGELKLFIPMLGKEYVGDNSKAKRILGVEFRDPKESAIEMAYALIERGIAKKTPKYKGVPLKYQHS